MATIVCQGLQSCLESQMCEPRTALRLKLSSQRLVPHFHEPLELAFKSCFLDSNTKPIQEKCHSEKNPPQVFPASDDSDNNHNSSSNASPDHSWSFLEAITNGGQMETNNKADKDQNVYVHPLSKRSASTLSEKSLELCTENLGSETGTDIMEDSSIFSSSSDYECENFAAGEQGHSRQLLGAKKASKCRSSSSFPPPLTTMSGLESLQVRTHREDGRLIIKAVKAPSPHSLFQAERSHGRLRLSIFKDSFSLFDSEEPEAEEEDEEMSTDGLSDIIDDDTANQDLENEEETHENHPTNSKEERVEEGENVAYREEDVDENKLEVGGEMGIRKKFHRTGRCNEGESSGEKKNIGLLWEPKPVWVATS